MNPKEKAIAALRIQEPVGLVPTFELDFELISDLLDNQRLERSMLVEEIDKSEGLKRKHLLKKYADALVEAAERLDYSMISGLQVLPAFDDQRYVLGYLSDRVGDKYLLAGLSDGTMAIPTGDKMEEVIYYLNDNKEMALRKQEKAVTEEIKKGLALIKAGADVICMCSDYCFNSGPFLSPAMFGEFVTPFLARQTAAFKEAGAFTIKHTDGDIMPILDQLIYCKPDALHSLDPAAGIDIAEVKRMIGGKVCLIGNVNCALLHIGTKEEIVQSARYALEHGMPGGGYIFSTSNCVFKGMPLENYLIMLETRKRIGIYKNHL